jgi:hypothetical protein
MGSLTGIIQKLYTQDQFLLFTTKSRRITGGTQETLRMLGECVDFEDGVVLVSQYLDDDTMGELMGAAESAASRGGGKLMKAIPVRAVRGD